MPICRLRLYYSRAPKLPHVGLADGCSIRGTISKLEKGKVKGNASDPYLYYSNFESINQVDF